MNKEEFQKALKPITDGLFGKQGTKRYERPHFPLRPLERMLEDLAAIRPVEWFRYVFSREPLNGKFTDEQRRSWMEQALACGQEYARKVMEKYKSSDPEVIAKAMGMKVSYPAYPEKTDRVLFAEYRCRLPRYLTKPRQRRSEWDMAGSDGISRVSTVFRGKSLLTNKMRII